MKLNNFLAAQAIVFGLLLIKVMDAKPDTTQLLVVAIASIVAFYTAFNWLKDEKR